MKESQPNRRKFIKASATSAAGVAAASVLSKNSLGAQEVAKAPRIKFSAIGLNHGHIYGQVGAVMRGGGELVSFFATEPDLIAAFSKRFPQAKLTRSEKEILEDSDIKLVVSASIPDERAPLGIRVMQHGKDFMADKPGITSLE
ncbi:MAG TPA: twin-arginine translocation signal domain-containing protein, partial [Pyrinomonadaceae bacterium]|nr:twin-arginine translocation signal domain-containing protein [Pyrinomonadaceae bacterium]